MRDLIESTVKDAMNLGADGCDVIVNSGEALGLSAQDGKLDKYKIAKTSILGIRVIKNKKIGLAYSESFDKDAIEFAVKSALANSEYSDTNEFEEIRIKNAQDIIEKNRPLAESSMEEKIEFTLKLESEVKRRDSRVRTIPYNGLSVSESKVHYLNSLGTYTETGDSFIDAYTSALIEDRNLSSMHTTSMRGKSLAQLNLDQNIDECLDHASKWLHAKPVASGKYDVIFDIEVLSDLLGSFSNYFSAKEAVEKSNPWESKLGQAVAISGFSLIDSPTYKDAFIHYKTDSEGMMRRDLALIDNGVLKSFYHNTSTAKFFKTESTGHASRGPRSSLNVGGTNWLIKPGTLSESDVTEGTYLEIIDVMGLGRGDNISGDFSFGASGYLCKDGKRIQPVKQITVAGNFNKLLLGIDRMGSELKSNSGKSSFSPLIRFTDLYIAGK